MLAFSGEVQSVQRRKRIYPTAAYFHIKSQVAPIFPHPFFLSPSPRFLCLHLRVSVEILWHKIWNGKKCSTNVAKQSSSQCNKPSMVLTSSRKKKIFHVARTIVFCASLLQLQCVLYETVV